MSVGVFSAAAIAILTLLGMGARVFVHGDLNAIHGLFSLFFSTNLLICYWEACLYLRRDYIEERAVYWRERQRATGRTPAVEFLTTSVPLGRILSPTVWADAWATYSMVDESYADRRTFGFTVDIANGFFTAVPTLVLYAAFTFAFLPAVGTGILAAMLFWQWTYVSSLYWVSFFVAGRQQHITNRELYTYVVAPNAVWVFVPMFGLYISVRLILDGNYALLGF
ncbi:MAG: hypothetical protein F4164_06380 [Gemmatimonadales bacterium]|nr:hypothetical protein [Gemmatimonadales bacterium]MYG48987.1 hypothetical protein [Gemmatimonadales bacterium]MYK01853.1 hypothetical protein [Candidatus Palauibacter ramosifaciens]